ncbi:hypothetical protein K461DRAFT_265608 [Myriangium duriaei CBS 260.36]|uniref:Uncharacterized protein n=1 Tax=Myriangium duriaei CBS 260.36 TaxID=1168546 RepID=A0A9P4JA05_9PEZI|nr:hypothetical protein K461DRAFT_265608 [Myriangium duriaei CBS 260.36]
MLGVLRSDADENPLKAFLRQLKKTLTSCIAKQHAKVVNLVNRPYKEVNNDIELKFCRQNDSIGLEKVQFEAAKQQLDAALPAIFSMLDEVVAKVQTAKDEIGDQEEPSSHPTIEDDDSERRRSVRLSVNPKRIKEE